LEYFEKVQAFERGEMEKVATFEPLGERCERCERWRPPQKNQDILKWTMTCFNVFSRVV
jgi:hypothetical protein